MTHSIENRLKQMIADAPDFPKKGILFRDIAPLLAGNFGQTIDAMAGLFSQLELNHLNAFAGIDARGFIFASALAAKTGKNFIMIRKSGKLPPPYLEKEYDLEYGKAKIQLKKGTGNIVIVDDVLATGGTMRAAADLCHEAGYTVKAFATLINLRFLNSFEWNNRPVRAVINYDD